MGISKKSVDDKPANMCNKGECKYPMRDDKRGSENSTDNKTDHRMTCGTAVWI